MKKMMVVIILLNLQSCALRSDVVKLKDQISDLKTEIEKNHETSIIATAVAKAAYVQAARANETCEKLLIKIKIISDKFNEIFANSKKKR